MKGKHKYKNIYQQKYLADTARMKNWNYGGPGVYFITISTYRHKCYFGEINKTDDGKSYKMDLSELGIVARQCWLDIPHHFPFVIADEFVIMPNHVHGIIGIKKYDDDSSNMMDVLNLQYVEAQNFAPLHKNKNQYSEIKYNKFGPQSKNLASVIRGYKTGVKKYATQHKIDFRWQSRYYEHIIRSDVELYMIRMYIKNNPNDWHLKHVI